MAFPGPAFLALWNDVAPQHAQEYNRWHTREHVPERVGIDGFIEGRRYRHVADGQREYFTAYGVEAPEVFRSPAYLAVIDDPTPWSASMRPTLVRVLRAPCRTLGSVGSGMGGALACVRLQAGAGHVIDVPALLAQCLTLDGTVAAHLGEVFDAKPEAFAHWSNADAPTHVLMLEAENLDVVVALRAALVETVCAQMACAQPPAVDIYELVFAIGHDEVDAALRRKS